jgi:hypothetical protein
MCMVSDKYQYRTLMQYWYIFLYLINFLFFKNKSLWMFMCPY